MPGKQAYRCETCGEEFLQWASQMGAKAFCSRPCRYESMRGKSPPNKGKRTVSAKSCTQCGVLITGVPSAVALRKFCSRDCAAEALRGDLASILDRYAVLGEPDQCWTWTGAKRDGYGRFKVPGGRMVSAHRASYERHKGTIPDGMVIDHLCRNRACINPAHLEAVTQAENIRRGEAGQGARSAEHKTAISAWNKRRYADPAERAKQVERLSETRNDPKRLNALAAATRTPEYRAKKSADMKRIWSERRATKDVNRS